LLLVSLLIGLGAKRAVGRVGDNLECDMQFDICIVGQG
jgi:hypothetical protein